MVCSVSAQLYPSRPYVASELESALSFLEAFQAKPRGRDSALEAPCLLVLAMEGALLRTRQAGALGQGGGGGEAGPAAAKALLEGVRKAVRAGQATLAGLREGEDPAVPASVHRASAEYHKLVGPAAACHASTLLYLGAVQADALPRAERQALALDIALASLVGEGIFNFGEVLEQPVLAELAGTPHAWLCQLLAAFQVGDIAASDACVRANSEAFQAQPTLRAAGGLLASKIKLLALMEMVLKRPTSARVIAFADIAAAVQCAEDQVSAAHARKHARTHAPWPLTHCTPPHNHTLRFFSGGALGHAGHVPGAHSGQHRPGGGHAGCDLCAAAGAEQGAAGGGEGEGGCLAAEVCRDSGAAGGRHAAGDLCLERKKQHNCLL